MIPMRKSEFVRISQLWLGSLALYISGIIIIEISMYVFPGIFIAAKWCLLIVGIVLILSNIKIYETLIKLHWALFKYKFYRRQQKKLLKKVQKRNRRNVISYGNETDALSISIIERGRLLEEKMIADIDRNNISFFED